MTSTENNPIVGGICGRFSDGRISDCYNRGDLSLIYKYLGEETRFAQVGGLCGHTDRGGAISKCYTTGSVLRKFEEKIDFDRSRIICRLFSIC